MSILSDSIAIEIQKQRISQAELAEASGLTPAAISQIISGTREPNIKSLLQICAALRLTPNDLFCFHNDTEHKLKTKIAILERKLERVRKILK